MRVNLIKVGNSRGIIIPAALLASCELGDAVELQIDGKKLVIEAIKHPREGWFDHYDAAGDANVLESIPMDEGDDEWVW
jgi:antitoxin MazE